MKAATEKPMETAFSAAGHMTISDSSEVVVDKVAHYYLPLAAPVLVCALVLLLGYTRRYGRPKWSYLTKYDHDCAVLERRKRELDEVHERRRAFANQFLQGKLEHFGFEANFLQDSWGAFHYVIDRVWMDKWSLWARGLSDHEPGPIHNLRLVHADRPWELSTFTDEAEFAWGDAPWWFLLRTLHGCDCAFVRRERNVFSQIAHEEYPLVPPHLMKELQATSAKALDKCRAAVAEAQKKVDSHKTGDSHISFADDKEMHAIRPLSPEKGVYV